MEFGIADDRVPRPPSRKIVEFSAGTESLVAAAPVGDALALSPY
jgi:hypothetical protein